MILGSLSALMTSRKNCQVRRVAFCEAAQDCLLGFIPLQCPNCKTKLNKRLDDPGLGFHLDCTPCELDIKIEIQ